MHLLFFSFFADNFNYKVCEDLANHFCCICKDTVCPLFHSSSSVSKSYTSTRHPKPFYPTQPRKADQYTCTETKSIPMLESAHLRPRNIRTRLQRKAISSFIYQERRKRYHHPRRHRCGCSRRRRRNQQQW